MLTRQRYKGTFVIACVSLVIAACSNKQLPLPDIEQIQKSKTQSELPFTPEHAIEEAEQNLVKAKKAGVGFYSPLHLKQARENITHARESLLNPPSDMKNAALMSAIAAKQYIANAYTNMKSVKVHLKKPLKNLERLKELNAEIWVPDEYESVMNSLNEAITQIEQGEVTTAKAQLPELISDLIKVEVSSLKSIHLGEAQKYLEKTLDINGDRFANQTYQAATNKITIASDFIEQYFRDNEGVQVLGQESLLAAKNAYYVALEARRITRLNASEAEAHTLELMSLINHIHRALQDKDIVPEQLTNQAEIIVSQIDQLKSEKHHQSAPQQISGETFSAPVTEELLVIETLDSVKPAPTSNIIEPQSFNLEEGLQQDEEQTLNDDENGFDVIESAESTPSDSIENE
jgi:hypothetical protein